jgi:serine/threonine protein kinase
MASEKRAVADPSTDVWAFGVIAFELLTAERAFPRGTKLVEVLSLLLVSMYHACMQRHDIVSWHASRGLHSGSSPRWI